MLLFDYQTEGVSASLEALETTGRALVHLATGLGKTYVKRRVSKSFKKRILFLCHDTDILEQDMEEYLEIYNENEIGMYCGTDKEGFNDRILFATFQTMYGNLDRFDPKEFCLVQVDECHHTPADTFRAVVEYFDCPRMGSTATLERLDGLSIEEIFGEPVISIDLAEAIAKKYLVPFKYRLLSDHLNADLINELTSERHKDDLYHLGDLNHRLFIKRRDDVVVEKIHSETINKKTIVFCVSIDHTIRMAAMLGNSALCVHSGMGKTQARERLNMFRAGEIQYLVVVNKANEGVDIPDAEVAVFLRSTRSKTILIQQLGRVLRKSLGKEFALVLDFVDSFGRLNLIREFAEEIEDWNRSGPKERNTPPKLHVSGDGFEFVFEQSHLDAMSLVERLGSRSFYPTWQEASKAAIALGITGGRLGYLSRYKEDPRLPSEPGRYYSDYPGTIVFLGGKAKDLYPTWQEASKAAIALGITGSIQYHQEKYRDEKLPGNASNFYDDFPGWYVFFGKDPKDFYPTWQEASKAAIALGVLSRKEYFEVRVEDERLPSTPHETYKDFPGYPIFLGGKETYPTWQEASKAAIALRVKTKRDYTKRRIQDSALCGSPNTFYEDFPGWEEFLGKTIYPTWQEASKAAIALGVTDSSSYRKLWKKNPRLPNDLYRTYDDFPGFEGFLGDSYVTKDFYPTWQEASKAAIALGIKSFKAYASLYKKDPRLPSSPAYTYSDFPGAHKFFGK